MRLYLLALATLNETESKLLFASVIFTLFFQINSSEGERSVLAGEGPF